MHAMVTLQGFRLALVPFEECFHFSSNLFIIRLPPNILGMFAQDFLKRMTRVFFRVGIHA